MKQPTPRAAHPRRRRPRSFTVRRDIDPGASPGTLRVDPSAEHPLIHALAYDSKGVEESAIDDVAELAAWLRRDGVVWINVDGVGHAGVIEKIGGLLDLHRLVLEDVMTLHQRPKAEEYGDKLFVVCHMPGPDGGLDTEQVSLVVAPGVVISFQERSGDCLEPVRKRIREGKGKIRDKGADYLCYAILDAIVDAYFPVLESYGERLEILETEAITRPRERTITRIHDAKRELLLLRRVVWPMREMINALVRESAPVVTDQTRVYLRDCYDHAVHLLDIVENYRETASGLMEVYLSVVSNRMNEVMKVLTIIATIFIPLTFVAGIYGMNFDPAASAWNMPELGWSFGYPLCLALMLATVVALLFYFRRLGWIGRGGARIEEHGPPPR